MKNSEYRVWLICIIVAALVLLLSGCGLFSGKTEHYKIIAAKPVVITKTVVKRIPRKCEKVPALADDAPQAEITAHHKRSIEILARCSK